MTKRQAIYGIFDAARYNLNESAARLDLPEHMLNRLLVPKEAIEVTLNPTLTDGRHIHIRSFIVRHRDALGPSKGGIRMSSTVTMDDIKGLSMEMTWKTALIGVPFGGGKSGICFDPSTVSLDDKEVIIRSFTRGAMRHIGPEIYIPAPDMGTNEQDMGHIRDCLAYSWGQSITSGCYVTGKPVILGGIVGRREATGRGVVYSIQAACEHLGINLSKARVAVQGFGNVGAVAASLLAGLGATIVAVSDISGGVYHKSGLDVGDLVRYLKQNVLLKGYPAAKGVSNHDVLTCDCDILVPAAAQSQITVHNSDRIKAKIIAEGANSPTEPGADIRLNQKNIFVIPDILCNAGGVFVSYLEYTQETQREQMTLERVNERLRERMLMKFGEVYEYARQQNLSLRQAAMDMAVEKVVEATNAMGLLP